MQPEHSYPQNDFLNALRKERKRVDVYLVSGIRLTGVIASFDAFVVMLSTPFGMQALYKRAISTVQMQTAARPKPHAPYVAKERDSNGTHRRGPSARNT
jgi:host factor-I protein